MPVNFIATDLVHISNALFQTFKMAEKMVKMTSTLCHQTVKKYYIFHTSNAEKNHDYLIKPFDKHSVLV